MNCRSDEGPTVLIIKDKEGYIYGGYASEPWERHGDFYGDMKSFLFQLYPKAAFFRPTGANTNLQWVSADILNILRVVLVWWVSTQLRSCSFANLVVCCELQFRQHPERDRLWRTSKSLWSVPLSKFWSGPHLLVHHIRQPLPLKDQQNTTRSYRMLGSRHATSRARQTRSLERQRAWEIQRGSPHAKLGWPRKFERVTH